MNANDLNAEIARCGLTIPKLAERIGMDKKTLYSRMKGETSFKQPEIAKISQELHLSEAMILGIFLPMQFLKGNQLQGSEVREMEIRTLLLVVGVSLIVSSSLDALQSKRILRHIRNVTEMIEKHITDLQARHR